MQYSINVSYLSQNSQISKGTLDQDIPIVAKQKECQLIICTKEYKVFYILQHTHTQIFFTLLQFH